MAYFKILVLIENEKETDSNLIAEHGLSLLIEIPTGELYLFDAGQGEETLSRNAAELGVDLSALSAVILSHGHYDHMGGLAALSVQRSIPFYAHPAVLQKNWVTYQNNPPKMTSKKFDQKDLTAHGLVFTPTTKPKEIFPGGFLSGPIEGVPDQRTAGIFTIESENGEIPDGFEHEQFLVFKSKSGWVLVTGCCHHGVRNTLNHARKFTGGDPVSILIGGLHTSRFVDEDLDEVWGTIKASGVKRLIIGHCTGRHAVEHAQEHSGLDVQPLATGSQILL